MSDQMRCGQNVSERNLPTKGIPQIRTKSLKKNPHFQVYFAVDLTSYRPLTGGTDLSQEISDDAIEQIVIKLSVIDSGAQATMNGVAVEQWDDLQIRLKSIAIAQASVPVIIDPESAVKAKFVVQAYDWSRQAGLDRVYLAVRQ